MDDLDLSLGWNDCEDCGPTPERAHFSKHGVDTYSASIQYGCYGGDYLEAANKTEIEYFVYKYSRFFDRDNLQLVKDFLG